MTSKLTRSSALDELAAQHTALRELMARCVDLADEVDAQDAGPDVLLDEVARLRAAFDAHNQFEDRPLLVDVDADWRSRAIDLARGGGPAPRWPERTPAEMDAEHRAMRTGLAATPTSELRSVLADLRAHLESEARYLLSRRVLGDDLAG